MKRYVLKPNPTYLSSQASAIEQHLRLLPQLTQERASIVAWELIENAVKFHTPTILMPYASIRVEIGPSRLGFVTRNRISSSQTLDALLGLLQKVKTGHNPQDLYMKRLAEVMVRGPQGRSQLGILKILWECSYTIEVHKQFQTVFVSAYDTQSFEEGKVMEPFVLEELTIQMLVDNDIYTLLWKGKSRSINPENRIQLYLESLLPVLQEKSVIIDFSHLDAMNSSTIPPLLVFLQELNRRSTKVLLIYNDGLHWQRASFMPLSVITNNLEFIKVRSVAQVRENFSTFFRDWR